MTVVNRTGNLLDSEAQIIMHQVNDAGVMGSGVAAAIAHKWPYVQEQYTVLMQQGGLKLGVVQVVEHEQCVEGQEEPNYPYIANLCAQDLYQKEHSFLSLGCPTSYDALWMCLVKLAKICEENKIRTIAMPYLMSSCRGGANWNIVHTMVLTAFENLDITIEIWQLPKE